MPVATISASGPTTFCEGGTVVLTSSSVEGNVWSTTETTESITVATTGTYNVTVTSTEGCVATSADVLVTVNTTPTVTAVTGIQNICSYVGTNQVMHYEVSTSSLDVSYYNWTAPPEGTTVVGGGDSSNFIDLIFDAAFIDAPNKQIRITLTNPCGIGAQYIFYLRADVPSAPSLITASSTDICASVANGTEITYSIPAVYAADTYCWTLPAGATSTDVLCGSTTRTIHVNYSSLFSGGDINVTATNGCGTSEIRLLHLSNLNIAATPVVNFDNLTCATSTTTVNVTPLGAGYLYSIDGGASQTDPQFNNVSSGTHTIMVANPTACLAAAITTITIAPQPITVDQPSLIVGDIHLCSHIGTTDVLTYSVSPVYGATSYNWHLDAGIEYAPGSSNGTNTIDVVVTAAYAGGTISVEAVSDCGSSNASTLEAQTIIPILTETISGPTAVCSYVQPNLAEATYSITPIAGVLTYNWNVGTATITSVNGTNTITVSFPSGFLSGDITVSVTNTCGTSLPVSLSVSAELITTPLVASVSQQPDCLIPFGSIEVSSPVGAGYEYSADGTNYQTSTTINNLSSGVHTVYVRNNTACISASTLDLTINTRVVNPGTPVITGLVNVCSFIGVDQTVYYTATSISPLTTFTWTLPPNGVDLISVTPSADGTSSTIGIQFLADFGGFVNKQLKVIATNNCGTSAEVIFYLDAAAPSAPGRISGPSNICQYTTFQNSSAMYTIPSVAGATLYTWTFSNPDGVNIITAQGSGQSTGQGTDTIYVTFPDGYTGGLLYVVASNGCGTVKRSKVINACAGGGLVNTGNGSSVTKGTNQTMKLTILDMQIFPNPTTNEFRLNVKTTDKEQILVKVMDANGRLMKTMNLMPYETIRFGNELRAGAYFIEAVQSGKKVSQRVIKF